MTFVKDYMALADSLNKIQERIAECQIAIKNAKTPEEVVNLIRMKKTLKHMQDLIFSPEQAYRWAEKLV